MKVRYSIAARINIAFGVIILAVILNSLILRRAFIGYQKENQQVTEIFAPSLGQLNLLRQSVNEAALQAEFCLLSAHADSLNKAGLKNIIEEQLPGYLKEISFYQEHWDSTSQVMFQAAGVSIRDTFKVLLNEALVRSTTFQENKTASQSALPAILLNQEINDAAGNVYRILAELITREEAQVEQTHLRMNEASRQFNLYMKIMTGLLILVALLMTFLTTGALVSPIRRIRDTLNQMSQGIFPREKVKESRDEIGDMSIALNSLVSSLQKISEFSVEIGKGNFDNDFKPLSEDDVLGNALINMRDELRKASEEEGKRKKEDDQRNWATLGLAKFGEILRQNNNNIEELSYTIISNLVDYTSANQGGLFLINNNDPDHVFIELVSCYAYNRKKYIEKTIEPGEGLIGRCIQERASIYITDLPEDYIRINSGLGDSNPTSLLIVPLLLNEEIFGAIELASFEELEPYKIEFVEKIGESIASTISTVKFNIQTATLLDQSRQQAEQMASQEEEMRQNMEELRATQEQSERRELELMRQLEELKERYNALSKNKE
ncbi:MAG: GAF domain-containing protein [Bacteroidales bacterium]